MKKRNGTPELLTIILLTIGGCGGGQPSSPAPPPPPASGITLNPSALQVTQPINATLIPASGRIADVTVSASLLNLPQTTTFLVTSTTHNGVDFVYGQLNTPTLATITLTLKVPETVKPGTYTDQVSIKICEDAGCSKPIAGFDTTLPITYVVTTPAQAPRITFSTTSFADQSLIYDVPLEAPLGFSLANFGSNPYITTTHQTSTVDFVNANITSVTGGNLGIVPKSPSVLGRGVFTDTLSVTVCLDQQCVNPVAGSPFTIAYQYTVGDTIIVPGSNGYTLRAVNLGTAGAVWDPIRKQIYLAQTTGAGSVVTIDPTTGTIGTSGTLAGMPNGAIAISDDAQYLYVGLSGTVQRLILPGLQPDIVIPLGRDVHGTSQSANDIAVMPGNPHTIAIALSGYSVAGEAFAELGAGIFDDATERPQAVAATRMPDSGAIIDVLTWTADGQTLYGANEVFVQRPVLYNLPVQAAGIGSYPSPTSIAGGRVHVSGSLLFSDGGGIYDLTTSQVVRTITPIPNLLSIVPAPDVNRVFALGSPQLGSAAQVVSLDGAQYSQITVLNLPSSVSANIAYGSLQRMGATGLIYTTNNFLVVITGPFVGP